MLIIAATQIAAMVRAVEDDIPSARDLLISILDVAAESQNDRDVADVYNSIAWFAVLEGDTATAQAYVSRALALQPPEMFGLAEIRHTAAEVAYMTGDRATAWSTLLQTADTINLDRLSETSTPAALLTTAAAIQLDLGNAAHAATLLAAAEASVVPGTPVLPAVVRRSDALTAAVRAALSEADFKAAWDEGVALSVPDALSLAKSLPAP